MFSNLSQFYQFWIGSDAVHALETTWGPGKREANDYYSDIWKETILAPHFLEVIHLFSRDHTLAKTGILCQASKLVS